MLILAVGLMVAGIILPKVWLKYLRIIYLVPVVIVNEWDWFDRESDGGRREWRKLTRW